MKKKLQNMLIIFMILNIKKKIWKKGFIKEKLCINKT